MLKLGWKAPFRGQNPIFGGARSSKNYQTLMHSLNPNVWCEFYSNRRRSILANFSNFSLYLWPPIFAVFGGLCTPCWSWVTQVWLPFDLVGIHIIRAFVDWNRTSSLRYTYISFSALLTANLVFINVPKKEIFRQPRLLFLITWWCDPQKAPSYARTRRLRHQPSKSVQRFGL
jgi:hypothetical protein